MTTPRNMYDDFIDSLTGEASDPLETETHASEHQPGGADSVVGSAKATPVAADEILIQDSEASDAIKTATQAQLVALLQTGQEIASDAACAIASTDASIELRERTSGDEAITTASSRAHQLLHIVLTARSGGSYTLAVTGGTLTFNATGEAAIVKRNAANDAWNVVLLSGATVV